jgi:UDP-glucuronate 4-epimerase
MNNILVTGGAGFIGSHLMERLLLEGRRVICLDNFNDYYDPRIKRENIALSAESPAFSLIEGDILNVGLLDGIFTENKIDTVVHLAARAGVRPSLKDPLLYEQVNCAGTLNLLEKARRSGVEHFVFGSSSSVYGINAKVPFSEADPINQPVSPYATTKRSGELMCYTYNHLYELPVTCLRFFTVYGPRQRPDMAIHKFTRAIHEGREIALYGDGRSRRDYTFIGDIIDGVVRAMDRPSGFKIYNLGESQTIELLKLIELIEDAVGKKAKIDWQPDQPGDVPITYADIDLARSELGYDPITSISEGIPRFVKWFMETRAVAASAT